MKLLPPPFEDVYSQTDLLAYLDGCQARVGEVLGSLARGEALDLQG